MPLCCSLTLIPICCSEEITGNTQGHKPSNWMRKSGGDKQEMLKYAVGVFFFPFKDRLKHIHQELGSEEKQHTHSRTQDVRYFWDASLPLKRNVTWLIHVCPTFYVRQEICIPSTLILLLPVTTNVILRAAATNKSWNVFTDLYLLLSLESLKSIRSRFRNNLLQAHLWHWHMRHLRKTWGH